MRWLKIICKINAIKRRRSSTESNQHLSFSRLNLEGINASTWSETREIYSSEVIMTKERSWARTLISSQLQNLPISYGRTSIFLVSITSSDNVRLLRQLLSSWSLISCGSYLPNTMSWKLLKSILRLIASCCTTILRDIARKWLKIRPSMNILLKANIKLIQILVLFPVFARKILRVTFTSNTKTKPKSLNSP